MCQVNPSCVDANNGSISLTVTGGNSIGLEYFYSINGADYLPFETEGNEFIIENLEIGEYDIIVKDIKGCEESCNIILETYNEECLEVPTLITPNGDRYNDLWEIENIDNLSKCSDQNSTIDGVNLFMSIMKEIIMIICGMVPMKEKIYLLVHITLL